MKYRENKMVHVLSDLWSHDKTLTFCNIAVRTEDIFTSKMHKLFNIKGETNNKLGNNLFLFRTSLCFLCACSTSLLKTVRKGVISPGCQIKCMCRNECESCRLKKKSHRFMSQCAPGCMKKNLLDLLKSSIPDISTRKLLRNCVYLRTCNSIYMYLIKARLRISQFLKIDYHFYPLLHYLVFSSVYIFYPKCVYPSEKSVCNAWI